MLFEANIWGSGEIFESLKLVSGSGSSETDTETGDDGIDTYALAVQPIDPEKTTSATNNRRRSNDLPSEDSPLNIVEDYSTNHAHRHFTSLLKGMSFILSVNRCMGSSC